MKIVAVTSWGGACGIANYAEMAIAATRQADPGLEFVPSAEALDPAWGIPNVGLYDVTWLNYHRGLHSRWTADVVHRVRQQGHKIVITFHDSYGESAPDPLCQQLHDLADAFVVHEPCVGLEKQVLIRQGVLPAQPPAFLLGPEQDSLYLWQATGGDRMRVHHFKQYDDQPVLGTMGFAFPWKNFDRLAEVTAEAGWAYLVLSNNATDDDEARWKASNPHTLVIRGFQPTATLVSYLAGCDATCFAYECANSGTSGAIRLGLAARKPVLAFKGCRQFRDLQGAPTALSPIQWVDGFDGLPYYLKYHTRIQRVDPGIVYLAHRDSWATQGRRYAEVFSRVAAQ